MRLLIGRANGSAAAMVIARSPWRRGSVARNVDWTNALKWVNLPIAMLLPYIDALLGMRKEWILSEDEYVARCLLSRCHTHDLLELLCRKRRKRTKMLENRRLKKAQNTIHELPSQSHGDLVRTIYRHHHR